MQREIRHEFNLPWGVLLKEQATQSTYCIGGDQHNMHSLDNGHNSLAIDQIYDEVSQFLCAECCA